MFNKKEKCRGEFSLPAEQGEKRDQPSIMFKTSCLLIYVTAYKITLRKPNQDKHLQQMAASLCNLCHTICGG